MKDHGGIADGASHMASTSHRAGRDFFRHGLTRISTFGGMGFTDYANYAAAFGRYKKKGWVE